MRVRTNYDTGPYIVKSIDGPCTCPEYVRSLDGDDTPSKPHFHLTVLGEVRHQRGKTYWLNGYTLDGRSVWNRDRLIDASQLELF
ncbi:hypothetical protein BTO02_33100 [Paraburkholderia sp. SOS3]|nr:hypothetical protein BTO02_33100 [Paraburkholderia sp. SOS3]